MEYYHEREEDNLDFDPHLHLCGSNPWGSLSYVNSATGEFCRGPDSDDENEFDPEQNYEIYSEDCVGNQNPKSNSTEEEEDDSFYLNGVWLDSQRSEQTIEPATDGTEEAESDGTGKTESAIDEVADSEEENNAYTQCFGTGSPADPQYLEKMRRLSEEANAESDDIDEYRRIMSEASDPYVCYICGETPENMVNHNYHKHSEKRECAFCGKKFKLASLSHHIRNEHRAETGLYQPLPKTSESVPHSKIDLEEELDKMRQSRDWIIVKKPGYCCLYDEKEHTPVAVIEFLTKEDLIDKVSSKAESEAKFHPARELKVNVDHKSFKRVGKDVGHLASRKNQRKSDSAYIACFSMLNQVPQDPMVNSGVIRASENHARVLVYFWDDVIIITGPIYDDKSETVTSINGVKYRVPSAIFKIIIMRRAGEPSRIQAFIFANQYENSQLFNRKATLEQISELTGLDLSEYEHLQFTWDLEEPMFVCPHFKCFHTFQTESELAVHLKDHPWKCPFCCKVVGTESDLKQHLNSHRVHICEECGKRFTKKLDLIQHERTHTGEKPYECTETDEDGTPCGRRFAQKSHLTRHKILHTTLRFYVCEEPGCGKTFQLAQYLTAHIRVHTGAKQFICGEKNCGRAFTTRSSLNDHNKRVHKNERPHQCPDCKKAFPTNYSLKRHINDVHLKIKDQICEVCGMAFGRPSTLKNHQLLLNHLPESAFDKDPADSVTGSNVSSAVSGKRKFDEISPSTSHKTVSAKNKSRVTRINAVLNSVSAACTSTRDATSESRKKKISTPRTATGKLPFLCKKTKCGLGFHTKDALIEHTNKVHLKEYPHRCKEQGCELSLFRFKCDLDQHTKSVHLNIKDHVCRLCGRAFSEKGNLQRHLRTTHKTAPASGKDTSDSATTSTNVNPASAPQRNASIPSTDTMGEPEIIIID